MKLKHLILTILSLIASSFMCCDNSNFKSSNTRALKKALVCEKQTNDNLSYSLFNNNPELFDKVNQFTLKLSETIGINTDQNIAVSPISAFMALALAIESSNGNTRQKMLDAVGITYEEFSQVAPLICQSLNREFKRNILYSNGNNQHNNGNNQYNMIKSVNSIWAQDYVKLNDNCLNNLSKNLFCDIFRTNFSDGTGNSLINAYIKNETRGFLDIDLQLDSQTIIALMNVLYIKDVWNEYCSDLPFSDKKYDFVNSDNSKTNTNLLKGEYIDGKAISNEKYKKFYTQTCNKFTLSFIVPQDGYTVEDIYKMEALGNKNYTINEGNTYYHTSCVFPEFSTNFNSTIKDAFKALGINFFEEGNCDFSNLTNSDVYCNDIKHITKYEVTKSGMEGAAVTVMGDLGCCMPPQRIDVYEDFIVDRAFVFVLTDSFNNVIFTGVVNKI